MEPIAHRAGKQRIAMIGVGTADLASAYFLARQA